MRVECMTVAGEFDVQACNHLGDVFWITLLQELLEGLQDMRLWSFCRHVGVYIGVSNDVICERDINDMLLPAELWSVMVLCAVGWSVVVAGTL